MKKPILFASILSLISMVSCNSDDSSTDNGSQNMSVSFKTPSSTASSAESSIALVFSKPITSSGVITINYNEQDVVYGTDYTLLPNGTSGVVEIPYSSGVTEVNFVFNKLIDALENEDKSVTFTITSLADSTISIQGNSSHLISFNPVASLGGNVLAEVGGSTQPNQVYFDFSSAHQQSVARDSWDLGFYSGNEYRVVLNGSIKMAVKQLEITDITQVVSSDETVAVGTFEASNMVYVDQPYGNISGTAIAEISANEQENKVYLVNLGNAVPTSPASSGSVNTSGDSRGWMKIKINRASNGYQLLYAPITSTTFTEVNIPKQSAYNFTFFSLLNQQTVNVEPAKDAWDIKFTTFTNEISGYGSYFYSDFVLTNTKGGVTAYKVEETDTVNYANFSASNVDQNNFSTELAKDQRVVGANWRSTQPLQLYNNVFFILKDASGNIYKFKFSQLQDPTTNERGFPKFEYKKL